MDYTEKNKVNLCNPCLKEKIKHILITSCSLYLFSFFLKVLARFALCNDIYTEKYQRNGNSLFQIEYRHTDYDCDT